MPLVYLTMLSAVLIVAAVPGLLRAAGWAALALLAWDVAHQWWRVCG
jgi:hypothetical protein